MANLWKTMMLCSVLACGLSLGCGKDKDKGTETKTKSAASPKAAAVVASTPMEKAWMAWKDQACACKDMACASQAASARMPIEKQYPDSMKLSQKNVAAIIRAGNACLQKAMTAKK